jgi:peptidoglycan/LPS O-acetylase OafA/YrhL
MRIKQIDFLRGIAILFVIIVHYATFIPLLGSNGWIGVDLFFVLSGYLVSGLLFSEYKKYGNIKPGLFLIRRGFKIYPMFYFFIFFSFTIILLGRSHSHPPLPYSEIGARFLHEILFVQNYLGGQWSPDWSLAIEEHFYFSLSFLLFTFCALGWIGYKSYSIPISYVCVALFCLSMRIFTFTHFPFKTITHYSPTHLRIDGLMAGVMVSWMYHFRRQAILEFVNRYGILILICSLLLISNIFFFPSIRYFFPYTIGITMIDSGFAGILMLMLMHEKSEKHVCTFISRPLYLGIANIGLYSYGIYLWHEFLPAFLQHTPVKHFNIYLVSFIYIASGIIIGILMSKLIEIPFLKIRDKRFPKRMPIILQDTSNTMILDNSTGIS